MVSHLDKKNNPIMVNVGNKDITKRIAEAEAEIVFDKLCNMMNPPEVFSLDELFLIMKGLDCQETDSNSSPLKAFNNGYLDISIHCSD